MRNTEKLIKEKFVEMTGNDCRDFLIKSIEYCKQNFPKNWEEDKWLSAVGKTVANCIGNKKLSLAEFKLINRYTNVIDVFNNLTKSWD